MGCCAPTATPTPAPHLCPSPAWSPLRGRLSSLGVVSAPLAPSRAVRGSQTASATLSGCQVVCLASRGRSTPSRHPSSWGDLSAPLASGVRLSPLRACLSPLRGCVGCVVPHRLGWRCGEGRVRRTSVRSGRDPMGLSPARLQTGVWIRGRPNFKFLRFPFVQIDLSKLPLLACVLFDPLDALWSDSGFHALLGAEDFSAHAADTCRKADFAS